MTEQQPPQDRPEFQPPGGKPSDQPAQPGQPYQSPMPPAQPPSMPYPPPAQPPSMPYPPPGQQSSQPYPQPGQRYPQPGQPYPQPGQPYPQPGQAPQQYPQSGQPGNYPPFQAAPPQPRTGRGSIWLGIGITIAALLASWGLAVSVRYDSPLASTMNLLAAGLPFALVLGGIVMAAIPRTTRTGAGILIGIGAAILIAGGLCFALVLGLGAFGG